MFVVGGIGGGGDPGLAIILKDSLNLKTKIALSFQNCPSKRLPKPGEKVRGALWRATADHPRLFEAKLPLIDPEIEESYSVCTRESWSAVKKGLDYFMKMYEFAESLHADLGGDALIAGYEENLGSYRTDTLGKASLYYLHEEYGVRSLLAVGNAGAEAWRVPELVAFLEYLWEEGAYLGSHLPPIQSLTKAKLLTSMGCTGMLQLFVKAVEGARVIETRLCYLKPPIEVKPWYKYVLFFNTSKLCELSPLCEAARKGWLGAFKKWRRPRPPKKLEELFEYYESLWDRDRLEVERRLMDLIERKRFV